MQNVDAVVVGESGRQRLDLRITCLARRGERSGAHAFSQHRGSHRGRDLRPRLCVERLPLRSGQVRQRQEDVGVRQDQMLKPHCRPAFGTTGSMDKRHAVTTIVRDDHTSLGADHLRHVELDELRVSREAVAPPLWLGREPVAREVQRADAESGAELIGDLEPVDAAGGPAVYEQQHRSAGIADLNVEYLNRRGALLRRLP